MCGRFAMAKLAAEYGEEFETLLTPQINDLGMNWNVAPTKEIYIIKQDSNKKRILENAYWGIIAPWSKDLASALKSQSSSINARSETVFEKPTFRNSFKTSRCLIPASGYYEWATELGPYKSKQPFFIQEKAGKKSLALTGIYASWQDPISKLNYQTAAILTKDSVGFLAKVHSRMPVFLPESDWDIWLDLSQQDPADLIDLIQNALSDSFLQAWPVSDRVNSTRNSGIALSQQIDLDFPQTLF